MHTILHIEPSEFFTQVIKGILKDENYEYISTDSYNEALILLEEAKIDLVLVSLEGNGMKSDEFIKNITYRFDDMPICVVSGNKLNANMQQFMNLGVIQYIDKENIENELVKYIENIFKVDKRLEELRDCKIAVVEDSHFSRLHLKEIFNLYGIKDVRYYESGTELIESKKNFDIYLIDLVLQDEFGKNIITDLRNENEDALIFAVTSLNNPKLLADVIDSGANDIISKPIEEKIFIAKMKSYMRTRKK